MIAEFVGKPLLASKPRAMKIPMDVQKIISLVGARRTGKTHIMYHIIKELRKTVEASRLVYINFEDDRIFPPKLEEMDLLVQAYYEMYILFKADIWHRSVRVQAVNPSKYYCIDPAFKYAMSINEDRGRVLENAVFLHLRRQGLTPHYFHEKQEVDFYWENGQPINVCYDFYDNDTRQLEVKGMVAALKFLDLSEGLILTRDKTEEIKVDGKTIRVEAAWKYFLQETAGGKFGG